MDAQRFAEIIQSKGLHFVRATRYQLCQLCQCSSYLPSYLPARLRSLELVGQKNRRKLQQALSQMTMPQNTFVQIRLHVPLQRSVPNYAKADAHMLPSFLYILEATGPHNTPKANRINRRSVNKQASALKRQNESFNPCHSNSRKTSRAGALKTRTKT